MCSRGNLMLKSLSFDGEDYPGGRGLMHVSAATQLGPHETH